jgi:hypothetical protein
MIRSRAAKDGDLRRLVLVDFDWDDADLVPELLHKPGIAVRLVAGERAEDPGVQLAEMCGLPRTLDLADLTREIFDLALVSERSPRRSHVEGLLQAMGTPSQTPQDFVAEVPDVSGYTLDMETALRLHAALLDAALGGAVGEASTGPVFAEPADDEPPAVVTSAEPACGVKDVPRLEDRPRLEAMLTQLMSETGATRAELRLARDEASSPMLELGPADPLLAGLIALAEQEEEAQVVTRVSEGSGGEAWGAWPFRTAQHSGVLAAAAIHPKHWQRWRLAVAEMRAAWDEQDRDRVGPAFPLVPARQAGWLPPADFLQRLELAMERHRRDGLRFALDRLDLPISSAAADVFAERLPTQLRDTDSICRPTPQRTLMLSATPKDRFPYLRGRLLALWQEAWLATGNERPIPGLLDERVEMTREDEVAAFLAQARVWLGLPPA